MTTDFDGSRVGGTSAFTWRRRGQVSFIVLTAMTAVGVASGLIGAGLDAEAPMRGVLETLGTICVVLVLPFPLTWGLVCTMHRLRVERQELQHGYTTFPDAHLEATQLHPSSSEVLRGAGQPFLERDVFQRLVTDSQD